MTEVVERATDIETSMSPVTQQQPPQPVSPSVFVDCPLISYI